MIHLPITNDKRQRGARSLGDRVPNLELLEFDAVFDREFTTDVHFVTYALVDPTAEGPEPHPRLNKPVLGEVRKAGGDIVTVAIALDFDLKDQEGTEALPVDDEGKPCWTTAALDAFTKALPDIDSALRDLNIAAPLVYTTTHGARFVHKLKRGVPVDRSEDLIRGLVALYKELDIVMDPACADWTRLFRAPKVTRGESLTWTERWFWIRWGTGVTDPDAIDPVSKQAAYKDRYERIEPIYRNRPSPEQANALLFTTSSSGERKSDMHKLAQRILRGTPAFGPCFDGRPIAEEGSRDQTLIKLVGSATNYLLGPMASDYEFTPEDIYALFLPAVEQLEPDAGTSDWTESLWNKVRSCYEREAAKKRAAEQQKDERREIVAEQAKSLLELVRERCDIPELHSADDYVAQRALRRLMLIREPSGRFRALIADGPDRSSYTKIAVAQGSLHHLIEYIAKLDDHIDRFTTDQKGETKLVSEQALARSATDVVRVCGSAGIESSFVSGESWDDLTLNVSLYSRNPNLEPEFSKPVHEWLERLTPNPELLYRWLSRALEFEGGAICALSLAGAPGAGKGMLCQGLVETLAQPVRAEKVALVSRFNDSLRRSPFMIVDEGLPKGEHDVADKFRQLTAGEPILTEEKYQTPVEIRNPMRIIFTANNLDVVKQLASDRMNDANDQSALAIRLLHLDVLAQAERHLRERGGLAYTEGWVQGANGSPSNFTLAKHLLWLYANRENYGPRDKRLLVEGTPDTQVVQSLRIAGTVPEAIAVAIITGLESPALPAVTQGISTEGDRLLIISGAIADQHNALRDQRKTNVQLSAGRIGQAMSNLLSPGHTGSERMHVTNLAGEKVRQRFWDVDVKLLWQYADAAGMKCGKLEKLVIAQHGKEAVE